MSLIQFIYRWIKYPSFRERVAREPALRKAQKVDFGQSFSADKKKWVVFVIPGADFFTGRERISGGLISITSLCTESRKLLTDSNVLMCTQPNDPLLFQLKSFKNDEKIYNWDLIEQNISGELILHLPEYLVDTWIGEHAHLIKRISQKCFVHINVMNQNIRLMPEPSKIDVLKDLSNKTTITTAHDQYCTLHYRKIYGVSLHKFSVWISPEQYNRISFEKKKNLLVYSPDNHPMKQEVLEKLRSISGLQLKEIKGLTYEEYKGTIETAKFSITFGEGLDGYFIEPVFSGAVSFAVYNEDFFTEDFKKLKGVYGNWSELLSVLADEVKVLGQTSAKFYESQENQFELLAKYYSYQIYCENIYKFYAKSYTIS